jgi:hypothetical protein
MRGGIPRRTIPGHLDQSREALAGERTAATLEAIAAHGRFPLEAIYDAAVRSRLTRLGKVRPCVLPAGCKLGGTRPLAASANRSRMATAGRTLTATLRTVSSPAGEGSILNEVV